ncbi:chemotaxis protein CheW [Roseivivax sp. CAU 1761]
MRRDAGAYLTFALAEQEFCLDVQAVREIRSFARIAALPRMPRHVLGVVNLNGTVLPVLDLALRLGLPAPPGRGRTVVVVARSEAGPVGLKVCTVADIVALQAEDISRVPERFSVSEAGCLAGIAAPGGRILRLLDLEALFAAPLPEACG